MDDSDFPSYTSVKDLCPVKFSEDPQLLCRPLTGSSDISLCSSIRGSSILSSNIAPTPPLRLPFQVTELLTFSLYSLDLGELRPTELFKFVKSDYQRASFVAEPALSSLAGSATVGHDKYAYLTAFPSNENGQITAEITAEENIRLQ